MRSRKNSPSKAEKADKQSQNKTAEYNNIAAVSSKVSSIPDLLPGFNAIEIFVALLFCRNSALIEEIKVLIARFNVVPCSLASRLRDPQLHRELGRKKLMER